MEASVAPPLLPATNARRCEEARTLAAIQTALRRQGYWPLQALEFHFAHGKVILEGTLPSYYLKQLAQETIRQVPGVRCIDNRTVVE